ncbi:MAG TPA: hypothetical protein VG206_17670 [Terriglobia bacterium]|nr:hypothetical protein [Terriglobia bacterium]
MEDGRHGHHLFHVVSDLHGQVGQLDRIAQRLLQLDRVNFPAGIRFDHTPVNAG